jgi:cell division protein FtsI (penicillin-binding protein 3)
LRVYPQGKLASNIIGVVGSEGTGLEGLEYALDHLLKGQDGRYLGEYVAGLEVPGTEVVEVPAIDGTSVTLTIDADIQAVAERVLADRLKTADAKSGDVVVIEPETGHIVAMATAPRFDPDNIKSGDSLGNQAVTDVFEPGSTSKIITMAAAIEEGEMTPLTELTIPSRLKRGGRYFKDHEEHGTLKLTLNGVLAQSSNMGSIMAAEAVGEKKFYRYLQDFGLGKTTKLGFPGESGGLLPDRENWSATTFPTLAFGQGMSVTALQAASIFATIANDGVRIEPTIIAGYTDSNGKYTEADAPKSKQIVSVKTAKQVREMLESVVSSDGTAPLAQIDGYRVAGKTGTAQKYDEELQRYSGYTASFIGMAPAEDPKYVVAVIIHNPVNGHFGGLTSGPVFRDVMTFALAKGKIAPSTTKRPKIPVEW